MTDNKIQNWNDIPEYKNREAVWPRIFAEYQISEEHKKPEDETTLYVHGGYCEDKLIKLLEGLQVHRGATVESLLKDGFTNYSEPILHKSWRINKLKDKYPLSFVMNVAKKTLKISEVIVFDECFGQPYPCGKEEYMQIEQIVNELVNKKILERCKE